MLIYCITNRGHYAVREETTIPTWVSEGEMEELSSVHIAVFARMQDARAYCSFRNGIREKNSNMEVRSGCPTG